MRDMKCLGVYFEIRRECRAELIKVLDHSINSVQSDQLISDVVKQVLDTTSAPVLMDCFIALPGVMVTPITDKHLAMKFGGYIKYWISEMLCLEIRKEYRSGLYSQYKLAENA
jgi:hypothetical protein